MGNDLNAEDLTNLDKQTLITMLMMANNSNTALQKTIESLNKNIDLLREEVASLRQARFGRKSEKNLSELDGQLVFIFNETEVTVDLYKDELASEESPEEKETIDVSYKRKKKVGKRKEDLSKIREREILPHDFSREELLKLFPDGKWSRLPDDVFCKPFLQKIAEHFCRELRLHFTENCRHPLQTNSYSSFLPAGLYLGWIKLSMTSGFAVASQSLTS